MRLDGLRYTYVNYDLKYRCIGGVIAKFVRPINILKVMEPGSPSMCGYYENAHTSNHARALTWPANQKAEWARATIFANGKSATFRR